MPFQLRTCLLFSLIISFPVPFLGEGALFQSQAQPHSGVVASVSGRVVYADTRQPARAARVTLIHATAGEGYSDKTGLTQLDGTFLLKNVPVGDYFITAQVDGYVDESPVVHEAVSRGGDALKTLDALLHIHVTEAGADLQFALQRGAALEGSVTWEDGSPAFDVTVEASIVSSSRLPDLPSDPTQPSLGLFLSADRSVPVTHTKTDDRGHFRLAGLAAGGYVIGATQRIAFKDETLGTYGLQAFELQKKHAIEAPVRSLSAGEERDGVEISLSVEGLHTVSGQVSAAEAGVHSGEIRLRDRKDPTITLTGQIQMDGTFTINYVLPGTYDVVVTASSQTTQATRCCSYVPSSAIQKQILTITDTDIIGLNLRAARLTPHE